MTHDFDPRRVPPRGPGRPAGAPFPFAPERVPNVLPDYTHLCTLHTIMRKGWRRAARTLSENNPHRHKLKPETIRDAKVARTYYRLMYLALDALFVESEPGLPPLIHTPRGSMELGPLRPEDPLYLAALLINDEPVAK